MLDNVGTETYMPTDEIEVPIMVNLIMITPAAGDTFTIVTVIMLVDGPLVGVARLGGTHDVLQHHGLRPLHVDVLDHREELRRGGVVPAIGPVPVEDAEGRLD